MSQVQRDPKSRSGVFFGWHHPISSALRRASPPLPVIHCERQRGISQPMREGLEPSPSFRGSDDCSFEGRTQSARKVLRRH